jgi:L-amino acid N-acyltransferase YncA
MVLIRPATPGDAPAVRQLFIKALKQEGIYDSEHFPDEDIIEIPKAYQGQKGEFLVAEENGRVVGTVGVFGVGADTVILRRYYVDEEYQGKGIGRALLGRIISLCEQRVYKAIVAISELELKRALNIYLSTGFRVFKTTDKANFLVKHLDQKRRPLEWFAGKDWVFDWQGGRWRKRE